MRRPGLPAGGTQGRSVIACMVLAAAMWAFGSSPAAALDVTGTVHFAGLVTGTASLPIAPTSLAIEVLDDVDATGSGEKCTVVSKTSGAPDASGAYPAAPGDVNVELLMERGGSKVPEGHCVVRVRVQGWDPPSDAYSGSRIVFVSAADISGGATISGVDLPIRFSKAVPDLHQPEQKECFKWVKKQLAKRTKCNALLLKKGAVVADRCKDAGPEPAGCDPSDLVEAILRFAHDSNDQQTDPATAEAVDNSATGLRDQVRCQKLFGKAAANYARKRIAKIRRKCLRRGADSRACRDQQSADSKKKLDKIDRCSGDQAVDLGTSTNTGRIVPDVESPCGDVCIDGSGVLDKKCLKSCFRLVLDDLTDGIIGEVPVCGNGIVQPPEQCDDGNTVSGDGCSDTCTAELS